MADERLEKREIKISTPTKVSGISYDEGDTVEVYGWEADRLIGLQRAEEMQSKSKKSESKSQGKSEGKKSESKDK